MRVIEVNGGGLDNLKIVERPNPNPEAGEVLVKWHATSLNFHDYLVAIGAIPVAENRIPMSDGAGEAAGCFDGVGAGERNRSPSGEGPVHDEFMMPDEAVELSEEAAELPNELSRASDCKLVGNSSSRPQRNHMIWTRIITDPLLFEAV